MRLALLASLAGAIRISEDCISKLNVLAGEDMPDSTSFDWT